MRRLAAGVLFGIAQACMPAVAFGQDLPPDELLRALRRTQDEMARGDLTSLPVQKALHGQLDRVFANPLRKEQDKQEWPAAVIGYVLNGAQPSLARRLLSTVKMSDQNYALVKAISEYLSGNMKEAAAQFDQIEFDDMDPRLAPYVALARATANIEGNAGKSVSGFELAIALGPGTLVEEVALRRLVLAGAQSGDNLLFSRSSNLYIRRYANSPYSNQFFQTFSEHAARVMTKDEIMGLLSIVEARRRRDALPIYIAVAQTAAIFGKADLIPELADLCQEIDASSGKNGDDQVKFYQFIAALLDRDAPYASLDGFNINTMDLSEEEKLLFAKASSVAAEVFTPLTANESEREKAVRTFFENQNEASSPSAEKSPIQPAPEMDNEDKAFGEKFKTLELTVKETIELTKEMQGD